MPWKFCQGVWRGSKKLTDRLRGYKGLSSCCNFSRFSSALPVLAAASSAFALSHPAIRARQAHPRRDLLDVCAYVDATALIDVLDILNVGAFVDICICISLLPAFVEADVTVQAAVNVLGVAEVTARLEALIKGVPGQNCHYPPHAKQFCQPGNPCGFTCQDGFVPYPANNPTECICPAPNSICNGICGSFPHGCSSQTVSRKRDALQCKAGQALCSVPGSQKALECVSKTDAETCGGCVTQNPLTSQGQDCTKISNVAKNGAVCNVSTCKVEKCVEGFAPSSDGLSCARTVKRDVVAGVLAAANAELKPVAVAVADAGAGVVLSRDFDGPAPDLLAGIVAPVEVAASPLVKAGGIALAGVAIH